MSRISNDNEKPKAGLSAPPEKRKVKLTAGSKTARLTAARLAAVQVFYQMLLDDAVDAVTAVNDFMEHRAGFEFDGDVFVPADADLLGRIVKGAQGRRADIDRLITANLDRKVEHVEPLLRAILTAGIFELLAHADIDVGIIIADYLNVTNGFYDGGETKLVNAVLDKIAKSARI